MLPGIAIFRLSALFECICVLGSRRRGAVSALRGRIRNAEKRLHAPGLDRRASNPKPNLDIPDRNCRINGTLLAPATCAFRQLSRGLASGCCGPRCCAWMEAHDRRDDRRGKIDQAMQTGFEAPDGDFRVSRCKPKSSPKNRPAYRLVRQGVGAIAAIRLTRSID